MKKFFDKIESTIAGEVSRTSEDLDYYSTDGGVFTIKPSAIVFPKDTNDVVKLVKLVNEYHDQGGDKVSITARGNGTDQGGGPINEGVIVDFMEHMDQILEIGEDYVTVQPGCNYGRMQNELKARGRFIPAYPASIDVATVGGAVANNSAGEKTVKYGATRKYVEAIQVVLADGSLVWVHKMSDEELNAKKDMPGLEGKIYTQIADLIVANFDLIMDGHPHVTKESSGYALWKAVDESGFDLGQVITGSQGTLCFITAIRFRTIEAHPIERTLLAASYYDSIQEAGSAAQELHELKPSALEIVDKNLLELVLKHKPELLEGLLPDRMPEIILLTEFDDLDKKTRETKMVNAQEVFNKHAFGSVVRNNPEDEAKLWRLRRSAAAVMWTIPGTKKALPIIEDGTVPPEKLTEFITRAYEIFEKHKLEIAIWGHAGDADLHMQPFMDLSKKSDRDKVFDVADDFYAMVHELGGTVSGEHNDSLMRAPYRPLMFGPEMEELFNQVKSIFDPENIFNPHKKVGVDFNYVKKHLRHEYSIKSLARAENAREKIDR